MNNIEDVSLVGCVYELPIAGISVDVGQDLNPYVFDIEITKYFLSKGLFQIVERKEIEKCIQRVRLSKFRKYRQTNLSRSI